MGYHEHKNLSPVNIKAGILIISDTRSMSSDESGKLICRLLEENGHQLAGFNLIKNEGESIINAINAFTSDPQLQAVIASGGTGLSKRDITIETVSPLFEKKMEGFGELFRSLSYQEIGTGCIMSRAQAGVYCGKIVICLPGSLKAVKLAMEKIILPELGHMVREATR